MIGRPPRTLTQGGETNVNNGLCRLFKRSAGRAPTLSYTLAFALQLWKITENLSQGMAVILLLPCLGGTGRRLVTENVCQAAELAVYPHQLTLSRTSQLEI